MSMLPPAGWYDDPEQFGSLRYWDGSSWTEHRAPGHGPGSSSATGQLSSVGSLLESSFSTLWARRVPIGIVVALAVVSWVVTGAVIAWSVDGLVWTEIGGWSGVRTERYVAAGVVFVSYVLVSAVLYLMISHQVLWARLGEVQPVSASASAAARGLPRLIGWILVVTLGAVGAVFVLAMLALVTGALALVGFLALLVAGVWLLVKLAFLIPACVERPADTSALAASAQVSKGRFWAVLGRLLLVGIIAALIGFAMSIPTQALGPTQEDIDQVVLVVDDELVAFDIDEFVHLAGIGFGAASIVSAVIQALAPLLGLAASAVLFAEVHGRPRR